MITLPLELDCESRLGQQQRGCTKAGTVAAVVEIGISVCDVDSQCAWYKISVRSPLTQ